MWAQCCLGDLTGVIGFLGRPVPERRPGQQRSRLAHSHVRVAQVSLPAAAVTPLRALPTTPSASRARSVVVPGTQYPDYESLHGPSLGRIIYLNKPEVHVLDPRSKRPEQLAELFVGIQVLPRRESSTFHGDPLRKGCSRGFPRTSRWPGNVLKDARPEVVGPRCGHTDVQVALPWFAEQIDAGYHRDLSALGRINGRSGQKLADATSKEVRVVPDVIIHGHNASFSALWSPAAVTTRTTDALYSLATAARSLPNVAAHPSGTDDRGSWAILPARRIPEITGGSTGQDLGAHLKPPPPTTQTAPTLP